MLLDPEPESKVGSSRGGVVPENVVRVDDPEGGGCDVGVEQAGRLFGVDGQIVLQDIVFLHSVFDEKGEAFDVEHNVVLDQQVSDTVNGRGTVERVMHRITPRI